MRRVIAHLDVDSFYASVERVLHPELAGRPVIVAGSSPRAVVTTASYEARPYGVHSGMPASRARRLCPHAVVLAPDFGAYREFSQRIWDRVRRDVACIERVGLDEAYLDLSDVDKPLVLLRTLLADIHDATGLTVSCGCGPSRLVAKVASDAEKPSGFVVLSREMACERFAAAAPSLLPGIGPKTAQRLADMGIDTLAALRAASLEDLQLVFGDNHGADLRSRAHFYDESPVISQRAAVSKSNETTFHYDVDDRDAQHDALRQLSEELCDRLAAAGQCGRTVTIKVRLSDFTTITRARTLDRLTRNPEVVTGIATQLLDAYDPPQPLRLLGVRLSALRDDDAPEPVKPFEQLRLRV